MGKASGSKADTTVKLVLIFFISLLSFSVGTYVGKQVSDSDYRHAALESDYNGGPKLAEHASSEEPKAEDAATQPITDEEVSSLTEEFVQKERNVASEDTAKKDEKTEATPQEATVPAAEGYTHRSKTKAEGAEEYTNSKDKVEAKAVAPLESAKVAPAEIVDAKPAPAAHAAAKAAERVAQNKSPVADAKKVKAPSTALPTVATTAIGKFTVQVGSYGTEAEAKENAAKLTAKGYSAFYVPAVINNKTWFRVSVGLFSDQKSATNYRTELLATQAVPSAIVAKIVK